MERRNPSVTLNAEPRGLTALKRLLEVIPGRLALISKDQAAVRTGPDCWSNKEELGHLIDSAANNHVRLVLIQIQDNPSLPKYDQAGWVSSHQYAARDWRWMIDSWTAINRLLLAVGEFVQPGSWSRACTIGDSEPLTLQFVLDDYVDHMVHHLNHIGVDVDLAVAQLYPENRAEMIRPISEMIARRWSPVAFDETRQVEKGKIQTILEAARWAPSCFNEQPWRYLVFDGSDQIALDRARDCLVDGNAWARKAPILFLSIAYEDFAANGKPNRHAQHDVGLASENLVLEAARLGLAAHQMAGYDADRARREFNIPPRFTPMAMIAVGYPHPGRVEDLPEKIRAREAKSRARKSVSDFAFSGTWDIPYKS
jgi:nitroreductase